MLNGILAKILSELTLATYPVFIKIVDISFIKKLNVCVARYKDWYEKFKI